MNNIIQSDVRLELDLTDVEMLANILLGSKFAYPRSDSEKFLLRIANTLEEQGYDLEALAYKYRREAYKGKPTYAEAASENAKIAALKVGFLKRSDKKGGD